MDVMPDFFLSVDWGTTTLRIRLVETAGVRICAEVRAPCGVATIAGEPAERAATFARLLAEQLGLLQDSAKRSLRGVPVVGSGMLTSTLGWTLLPYACVPFGVDGAGLRGERMQTPGAALDSTGAGPVFLISGVQTSRDVMRGEETEILGLFSRPGMDRFADDSLLILPGTHSKHVRIRGGAVIDFATCMTGELFDVLARQSVLRQSLPAENAARMNLCDAAELAAFQEGVREGQSGALLRDLFQVRVRHVLAQAPGAANQAYLRGLLLGAEIFALRSSHATVPPVVVAGGANWHAVYGVALAAAGIAATILPVEDVESAAVRGHAAFLRHMARHKEPGDG